MSHDRTGKGLHFYRVSEEINGGFFRPATGSANSIALIESFYNSGKLVAAVCHAPAVLHRVIYKGAYEGAPIVEGEHVTGFANTEEEEVQLTHVVPFLVEEELKRLGGIFEKAPNWQSFVITDGRLITGQNPASSTAGAEALLKLFAGTQTGSSASSGA